MHTHRVFVIAAAALLCVSAGVRADDPASSAPQPSVAATPPSAAADAPPQAAEAASSEQPKTVAEGWFAKLRQGGNTAKVQLALSIFGAAFAFERFFHLRRRFVAPRGLSVRARALWKEGKFDELDQLADKEPSTLARVISFISKHRHCELHEVSMMAGDIVAQELTVHSQRAYPLGVIASLEPLLGLLGMILGMIQTFEVVAIAGALGNPAQLASGISEALVTTGLGLAIAIPFLALHHFFKSKTSMFGAILEKEVTDLLSEWMLLPKSLKGAAVANLKPIAK